MNDGADNITMKVVSSSSGEIAVAATKDRFRIDAVEAGKELTVVVGTGNEVFREKPQLWPDDAMAEVGKAKLNIKEMVQPRRIVWRRNSGCGLGVMNNLEESDVK